jgi:hypothetical protein
LISDMIPQSDPGTCDHPRTRVEVLPPGNYHYARVVCAICGTQICYKAHPHNAERRKQNAIKIQKLLGSNRLTERERGYCERIQYNNRPRARAFRSHCQSHHPRFEALVQKVVGVEHK